MSHDELRVSLRAVESVLVLRLSGEFVGPEAEKFAQELADDTAAVPPPRFLVLDLREVTGMSAAGARTLGRFAERHLEQGVRSAAVLGGAQPVARIVRAAIPAALLPVYPTIDGALATRPSADGPADALGDQLAALTRVLLDATTVEQALRQVASAAVVVIPHSELVSITLQDQAGRFFTPIETDAVALELDRVQYEAGRGPCVDAARPDGPGYSLVQDLSRGTPWPQFATVATHHGFGSVLSTALQPAGEPAAVRGALNVYSHREGITEDDRHRALLLATHGSLALARTRTTEVAELQHTHLRRAIESRDVIGQAKGILMARQGLSADQAFGVLRKTSQDLNVKLADIATTLVDRHTEARPR